MLLGIIVCLFIFNLLWLLTVNPISSGHKRDSYSYFFRRVTPETAKKKKKHHTSRHNFRSGKAP